MDNMNNEQNDPYELNQFFNKESTNNEKEFTNMIINKLNAYIYANLKLIINSKNFINGTQEITISLVQSENILFTFTYNFRYILKSYVFNYDEISHFDNCWTYTEDELINMYREFNKVLLNYILNNNINPDYPIYPLYEINSYMNGYEINSIIKLENNELMLYHNYLFNEDLNKEQIIQILINKLNKYYER